MSKHKKIKSAFIGGHAVFVESHQNSLSFMINNNETLVGPKELKKLNKLLTKHLDKWK